MPDVRLIDANAVLKEIKETYCTDCNNYNGVICRACNWMDAMDYIEDAPTIYAQPVKRGKWIDSGINGTVQCSECKFTDFFAKRDRVMLFGYCPNCGAKMEGE